MENTGKTKNNPFSCVSLLCLKFEGNLGFLGLDRTPGQTSWENSQVFDSFHARKRADLTVNKCLPARTRSQPCYVDSTWKPGPWCGGLGRLVWFGCSRAASLMWSILTCDCSSFTVQHLASIPAGRNPGGWLKVNGWREGPQGTIGELKLNTNLVLMALSVNQKVSITKCQGGQAQAKPLHL